MLTDVQRLGVSRARVVLMLHDVVSDAAHPDESGFPGPASASYKLTRARFSRLLDAVEASDLPVDLTFDDGGSSATPIAGELRERGCTGFFFITTARIGTAGFLSADGVRELRAAGQLVGSHSHTHAPLPSLSPAQLREEWRRSRDILQDVLGEPVTTASVPNGLVNRRVYEEAADAGYRVLYLSKPTTRPFNAGGLTQIGRFPVRAAQDDRFLYRLVAGEKLPRRVEYARWFALGTGKRALGPGYHAMRQVLMSVQGRGPR